jgi:carbon storage regulator
MLVLSRKAGETLFIGDDVKITISRIAGNRVTVGVEAPRHMKIVRGELERFTAEAAGTLSFTADEAPLAPSLAK